MMAVGKEKFMGYFKIMFRNFPGRKEENMNPQTLQSIFP
jgi:hypothetical protein